MLWSAPNGPHEATGDCSRLLCACVRACAHGRRAAQTGQCALQLWRVCVRARERSGARPGVGLSLLEEAAGTLGWRAAEMAAVARAAPRPRAAARHWRRRPLIATAAPSDRRRPLRGGACRALGEERAEPSAPSCAREVARALVRLRCFLPAGADALRAAESCPDLLLPGAEARALANLEELRAVLVPYDALVSLLVEEEPSLLASGLTLARLEALRESWEEQAVAVRSASDERALRDGASLGASKRAMWGPWVANYLACHF